MQDYPNPEYAFLHAPHHLPVFFRLVASRCYPLDEALFDRYADLWNWA